MNYDTRAKENYLASFFILKWKHGAYQISFFNACLFLLEILPNLGKYKFLHKLKFPHLLYG